jgi:TRAP-type C4-dicarboxylate transport system permease small subunit
MKKTLAIVLKWLDENFERYLGIIFSLVMFISLFLQVLFRYVFRYPLPWSEEVAVICFVLSVYFGAAVAVKRDQHIRIEIVTHILQEKPKLIVKIIADILFIVFCIFISIGLIGLIQSLIKTRNVTAVTRFPKAYIYACLPICMGLMSVRLIQDIIKTVIEFIRLNKKEQS